MAVTEGALAPYPQIVEYNEAVQHAATAFPDPELRQGQVRLNALGLPIALSGGFALTYMMTTPRRNLAVRCFHRRIPSVQQKYAAIARATKAVNSSYFVGFDYLADGIRIRGGAYPVLKMEWAEGDPLGLWLDKHSGDRRAIEKLREQFAALAAFLERHGIAHGDIQNGNVIVSPGGLRLVDYDGMFVPGMPGEFGCESGHKHFQHPDRAATHFGPTVDRFSFIAVDLSLAALVADPSLHRRFRHGGEAIVFRANDFADPENSEVFRLVAQQPGLEPAVRNFAAICRADIAAVPTLADFRAGRNIPSGRAAITAAAPSPALRPRAARYIGPYAVLRAEDFAAMAGCVGHRVELIGRVRAVRRGIGGRGDSRGKACVRIEFAPASDGAVEVRVWAEDPEQLREAPDEQWVGRYVSVVGLVETPYTERNLFSQQARIGISSTHPREIDVISEEEARFRLRRGESAATTLAAPESAPAPTPTASNRHLVARLLGGAKPAAVPAAAPSAGPTPPARQPPAGPSNRDIVQALARQTPVVPTHPAAAPPPMAPPPVPRSAPLRPPARPPQRASQRPAPQRPAMPKSGSVVIHPRNRKPRPPPPAAATAPAPTGWRRMLRYLGFGH